MAYTPGPWSFEVATCTVEYNDGYEFSEIAIVATGHVLPEESNANGHLIAAAPELLATIRAMISDYENYSDGWLRESIESRSSTARFPLHRMREILDARAAIAKAEGK